MSLPHVRHRGRSQRRTLVATAAVAGLGAAMLVPASAFAQRPAATSAQQAAATPAPSPSYPVVASGLDNPRQLAFSHGDLYVAESGRGGDGPCIWNDEHTAKVCFGKTGAVTRVHRGHQRRVLSGLPSLAPQVSTQGGQLPPGAEATGPSDVAVGRDGRFALTVGLGSAPSNRFVFSSYDSAGQFLGTLATGRLAPRDDWRDGRWRHGWHHARLQVASDIAGYEAVNNPVPPADQPDSNPNAVLPDRRGYVVADAGANDLLRVGRDGRVRTIATFATTTVNHIPMQAVPTSVVRGPGHAYYVSELTGYPFPQGGATIFKVVPGHAPKPYATGLTNVTDLAFGRHGTLYAVEIAAQGLTKAPVGEVVAVAPGGGSSHPVAEGLFAPYGIALRHHHAYVTTSSILPGAGKVVRIPLR